VPRELLELGLGAAAVLAAGIAHFAGLTPVLAFAVAAGAIAVLARLVGLATEQLGARLGSGPAAVIQSALGNLPELFIALFALSAGLVEVVQAALVGSILANSLLVLGLAFVAGRPQARRPDVPLATGADDRDAHRAGRRGHGGADAGSHVPRACRSALPHAQP